MFMCLFVLFYSIEICVGEILLLSLQSALLSTIRSNPWLLGWIPLIILNNKKTTSGVCHFFLQFRLFSFSFSFLFWSLDDQTGTEKGKIRIFCVVFFIYLFVSALVSDWILLIYCIYEDLIWFWQGLVIN